jgi:hypothetical protein
MALICSDVEVPRINPQVFHNPLNTGVDGYAHTMHSFMNSGPLEYSPATFSVVPAQGDAGAWEWGLSEPWLTLWISAVEYMFGCSCRRR